VRLFYANRDRDSVIFRAALGALGAEHGERLSVVHHLDDELGLVQPDAVRKFAGVNWESEFYVCGPGPFMDIVEEVLLSGGVDAGRIHIERFIPPDPSPEPVPPFSTAVGSQVTIDLAGRVDSTEHRPGTTILQTARQMGMAPPFSCESGSCATCMARLVEGTVDMFVNNALDDDEVAEGWVLTCQSVPTSASVHVVYEEA
jgi:ferredoxin